MDQEELQDYVYIWRKGILKSINKLGNLSVSIN